MNDTPTARDILRLRCVEGPITRRVRLVTNEKGEWSSIVDENSGEEIDVKELHFPAGISALALAVIYERPLRQGPDGAAVTREEVWICLLGPKPQVVAPPCLPNPSERVRTFYQIPCPNCGVAVVVLA